MSEAWGKQLSVENFYGEKYQDILLNLRKFAIGEKRRICYQWRWSDG